MSLTLSPRVDGRPAGRGPGRTASWLGAGGLLLAEYLLTSYAVDIRPLAAREDWLAALGSAGDLGSVGLAVATATLLVGSRPLLGSFRRALETAATEAGGRSFFGRLTLLAIHTACFAAFLSLTHFFAEASEGPIPYAVPLVIAWFTSGLAALLALTRALLPLDVLLPLLSGAGRTLALGAALGITAWAGGVATLRFWDPLGASTLHAVAAVLRLAGPDVFVEPASATLVFEGFAVVISPVCSGYEGIGLLAILTGAYLWIFRSTLRFPHVLALMPIGIGLSWMANVVRIAALILVGARGSSEIALGGFHSKAGWLLFCGIALGLVALTRHSPLFSREARLPEPTFGSNPTAAYLMPLLALVAAHLATGLFTTGFPLLYPVGVFAAAAMLWRHRREYRWMFRPTWSWQVCALGVAAFAVWIALEPAADPSATEDWRRGLAALSLPATAVWLAFRALGSVVVVPVVEELAFRGYLVRRLVAADFTSVPFSRFGWVSFLASSAAYGLLHERWLAGILTGMVFALAQYRRGRLGDAILAHAITNLLIAVHVIGWQRWSLWT